MRRRSERRPGAAILLGLLLAGAAGAGAAAGAGNMADAAESAETQAAPDVAHIVYLTTSTADVDAGTERGLTVGAHVDVVRDGAPIATLEVEAAASRRSSCRRIGDGPALAIGDEIRWSASARALGDADGTSPGVSGTRPPGGSFAASAAPRPALRTWLRSHGLRGRAQARPHLRCQSPQHR